MLWNASLGDTSFSSGFGPSSILTGDSIYVASENQLVDLDLADGTSRILINDPDYEFVPWAQRDEVLITPRQADAWHDAIRALGCRCVDRRAAVEPSVSRQRPDG